MAVVNDEKTITKNHESEKVHPPVKMQYTEKNYLTVEPQQTTYFQDKFKKITQSKGISAEVIYQTNRTADA